MFRNVPAVSRIFLGLGALVDDQLLLAGDRAHQLEIRKDIFLRNLRES